MSLNIGILSSVKKILPSDLPNLEAWYKADAGITTVSSEVSVWADQSGNGRDVTQNIATNRPIYGSETLNGIDVLTFNGNNWLNAAAVSTFNFLHQDNSTVFIVVRSGNTDNPNATYCYMASLSTSATVGYLLTYEDLSSLGRNNGVGLTIARGIVGTSAIFSINNDKVIPNSWGRIGISTDVNAIASDRMDGFVDGVAFDGINTATEPVSLLDASFALRIGKDQRNLIGLYGAIAEIIMYSRKLSVSEVTQVDNYLKAKYAL